MRKTVLQRIYYNPYSPGSFGGVRRLKEASRKRIKDVKRWLGTQDTYTLHKPVRTYFPRRKTIVSGIRSQYQADLIDVQKIKKINDNYAYILTCIDVFSKKGDARAIKNKTSTSVIPALNDIFNKIGKPFCLQTDAGGEFLGRKVQEFLTDLGIKHFTSQNEVIKASVVERFNQSLKNRLWRAFTKFGTYRYLELLPKIIKSYNNSYHSSIRRTPNEVNVQNQEEVWQILYGGLNDLRNTSLLKPGTRVRVSNARKTFKKGYEKSWTEELFTVSRVLNTSPRTYIIKDDAGTELIGSFYKQELQEVGDKTVYKIESILQERGTTRNREILVKWLGYPASFNSWIPKRNITRYKS